jgi:hypothetical protein
MMKPSAAVFLALALCQAGPVLAAPPAAEDLLRIVFPGWDQTDRGRLQQATLAATERGWGTGQQQGVMVDPKLVIETSRDGVTLLAGLVPKFAAHVTPMALSAYHFRRAGAHWVLEDRQEGFGYRGFFGEATLRQIDMSSNTAGVGVEYGSCWGGFCGSWLTVYQVRHGKVQEKPVAEITLAGFNYNSAGDCRRRLQPLLQLEPGDVHADEDTSSAPHSCYKISATWSVAPSTGSQPGEMTIHYSGAISQPPPASAVRAIDQDLVLRFIGGEYRVVSGEDPVPRI